jgi:hypothetical protein
LLQRTCPFIPILRNPLLTILGSGSIASISRLVYVKDLTVTGVDFWVKIQALAIVSSLELGLGITATSLATLRPLLRRTIQNVRLYRTKSTFRSRPTNSDVEQGKRGVETAADPWTMDTGAITLTVNFNNVNFLLSATNPHSVLQTFDEKNGTFLHPVINTTLPLSSIHSDSAALNDQPDAPPANIEPQMPILRDTRNGPYQNLSDEQVRATWWDLRSILRNSPAQSTEMATQGSAESLTSDFPDMETSQPPLQTGFRRWVIH